MKRHVTVAVAVFVLAAIQSRPLAAQVNPGGGGDSGCDHQCVTLYNQQGSPIGHGCTTGGDRGRTNCVATTSDCTTDPCGDFGFLAMDGRFLGVGTCQERRQLRDDSLGIAAFLIGLDRPRDPIARDKELGRPASDVSANGRRAEGD
jgi:hypothetical protein